MRLLRAAPLAFTLIIGTANAQTELELFFPVPVQGKLANEMQRLIGEFDASHSAIHVTAAYTGSYDDTNLKTRAAIEAGKPPGAVIMSANFAREYAINDDPIPLDDIIAQGTETRGQTPAQYMDRFWPALRLNAMEQGHVFGVPFQNSTPLLYYSVDAFKQAGLDPDRPPSTWQEWVDALRKLTKRDGDSTTC
ncbi:MAG TPA: extracellular solute-binding protein [Acetobacteraceae bacterium]|jgi:sn-glycerol 3-phosphate transport system substrate-binding protein|nr:extracellular solute-binding protein [Acetobacteraceae bacterium]